MTACPRCAAEVPTGSRYCPACGNMLSSVSQMPTELAASPPPATGAARAQSPSLGAPIGRLESSASFSSAAFQPGQMLAGRYRVIGLLGRGGMGEVYRADDLELSQPVSLKFLGRGLSGRPDMLERFRAEVRNARGVSHPNICRVYDIGEVDGQYFLSMEYVDGEDLGTLLKRIGRLPHAKAEQVARQLCAGLAAAHDRGVIHRDLKPSNVMIDGEGRVRITDFGLAVRTADGGSGEVVGTPAYMAPEQFEGKPATAQTDLYALGLILYEVYTGHRALDAATWEGWRTQHSRVEPRSPGEIEKDVEEPVARAILRCLEKDPARRPHSALQLAASLPGGDPLTAALAAGETPSPQMVAASGGEGSLAPRVAWIRLGMLAVLVAVIVALAPAWNDLGLAPLTSGYEALEARARDMVTRLGYTQPPRDEAAWLQRAYDPLRWRAEHETSTHWRHDYGRFGPPLELVYRQSPRLMSPTSGARVTGEDPPHIISGMVVAVLSASGRLEQFSVVPPQVDSALAGPPPARLAELFAFADLDTAAFRETVPVWTPSVAFDVRREWLGHADWLPGVPLRVSAAWWHGRPVSFAVRGPWSQPTRMIAATIGNQNPIANTLFILLILSMLVLGIVSGRRRVSEGRGDSAGGLRLAGFVVMTELASWVLAGHHTLDLGSEFSAFAITTGIALVQALFLFLLYLAVEPQVRRRTPELLIGWVRVLQGRIRDPRVGRDVLVGAGYGALVALVYVIANALPTWVPFRAQTPIPPNMDLLSGGRLLLGSLLMYPVGSILPAFTLFGAWFLLRLLFRRSLPAAIGLAVVMTLLALGAENPMLEVPEALLYGAIAAWVITRHGLLAFMMAHVVRTLLVTIPLPFAFTSPYAFQAIVCLAIPLALALWAFRVALAGRPAFAAAADD